MVRVFWRLRIAPFRWHYIKPKEIKLSACYLHSTCILQFLINLRKRKNQMSFWTTTKWNAEWIASMRWRACIPHDRALDDGRCTSCTMSWISVQSTAGCCIPRSRAPQFQDANSCFSWLKNSCHCLQLLTCLGRRYLLTAPKPSLHRNGGTAFHQIVLTKPHLSVISVRNLAVALTRQRRWQCFCAALVVVFVEIFVCCPNCLTLS